MNNREYITRTWLCFFVWVSSWSQHTGGLRYKSSLRHQDLVYVHVAEVLELVVSKWTMGWDGMGHRGLRNKWPGLPVAMLFPVFGSIEHLNELEQRNIGIRRWSRLFSPEPNRAFDFSIIRPCFFLSLSLSFFSAILISSSSSIFVESLDLNFASGTENPPPPRFWWNQFPALSTLSP